MNSTYYLTTPFSRATTSAKADAKERKVRTEKGQRMKAANDELRESALQWRRKRDEDSEGGEEHKRKVRRSLSFDEKDGELEMLEETIA